ncbi:hypothetical protein ACFQH3_18950 [Haladaptatus sp. GCM10025707]|uniref:hypothetical protein n=1 Tax=Haladaptatus sp. GCM10025707 TaxID=3252658 RepID=UPI003616242F
MTENDNVRDLHLSDEELIEVLKNHGVNRRPLMKLIGAGAALSLFGGTAAAMPADGRGNRIDTIYGAPYAAGETVPSGLVDHTVTLHIHEGPGDHPDFPLKSQVMRFPQSSSSTPLACTSALVKLSISRFTTGFTQ